MQDGKGTIVDTTAAAGQGLAQVEVTGAFVSSLQRNNAKIRQDRAQAIGEDAQLVYKRSVEDLVMNIRKMKRDQESMLDLSPKEAQSLVLASDFDAAEYVRKDVELSFRIRQAELTLEIANARYKYLFGA